jgi:cytochrome c oxidase subunit 3
MLKFLTTRQQRGMALFLMADFVVFLVLFASYLYLRSQAGAWPVAFHFASALMAFAITLFALSGSFTMFYAVRYQVRDEDSGKRNEIAMRLTVATIAVLGCVLIMLGMEWVRLLFISDVTFTANPYGVPAFSWTYFSLTGFYGLHVLGGVVYLMVVASNIQNSDAGPAALFVHFTNIIWLVLVFGLYFASGDLQGI